MAITALPISGPCAATIPPDPAVTATGELPRSLGGHRGEEIGQPGIKQHQVLSGDREDGRHREEGAGPVQDLHDPGRVEPAVVALPDRAHLPLPAPPVDLHAEQRGLGAEAVGLEGGHLHPDLLAGEKPGRGWQVVRGDRRQRVARVLVGGPERLRSAARRLEENVRPYLKEMPFFESFLPTRALIAARLEGLAAAGGMRRGGMTLSQEQLSAACDEARKQGLRTLVHAYREAVRAATLAGCTQVEHGLGATDDDLKAMAARGTYFDPQGGLLLKNYLLHKEKYLGPPFYPEESFAAFEQILPMNQELMRRAAKTPGLKVVFGSDAVAGAHGRNAGSLKIFAAKVEPTGDTRPRLVAISVAGVGDCDRSRLLEFQADQLAEIAEAVEDATVDPYAVSLLTAAPIRGSTTERALRGWRLRPDPPAGRQVPEDVAAQGPRGA